jgi:hypothetical protein
LIDLVMLFFCTAFLPSFYKIDLFKNLVFLNKIPLKERIFTFPRARNAEFTDESVGFQLVIKQV